jgi:nucleotide-binding universal stress UspA family protein
MPGLRRAHSVRAIPKSLERTVSETYIVGFDGSHASRSAVRFAERLGESSGATVIAAAVYAESVDPAARERAEWLLGRLGDGPVRRLAIAADSPAAGLHRLTEELGATLLAVGVTHHGPAGRLIPGSVGEHLLQGARCPVVVVPSAYEDADIRTVTVAYDGREDARTVLRAAADLALGLGARLVAVAAFQPSLSGAPEDGRAATVSHELVA